MVPLLAAWPAVAARLRGRPLVVFLDFDGTLVPIRRRPGEAVLSPSHRAALRRLAALPSIGVAIVSGRALGNLRRRVGVPNLVYVGNHGLEMKGPGFHWEHPRARALLDRHGLRARLRRAFRGLPGIIFEDKGLSMSVHYRLAGPAAARSARAALEAALAGPARKNVRLREGKKVWEIRPAVDVNKGTAVAALLKKRLWDRRALPIYIGDDVTDEDALRVVRRRGLAVRVAGAGQARRPTHAAYVLPSSSAVYRFFARLAALRRP